MSPNSPEMTQPLRGRAQLGVQSTQDRGALSPLFSLKGQFLSDLSLTRALPPSLLQSCSLEAAVKFVLAGTPSLTDDFALGFCLPGKSL